jgi:hypothetical protein
MWHSCTQADLEAYFAVKAARQRDLFNAWLAFVQKHGGPVTVISQKTRISFQAQVRFAGALIRRNLIECSLWLKRRVDDPRFHGMEKITARDHVYYFRLADISQPDEKMKEYIMESYAVGQQKTY